MSSDSVDWTDAGDWSASLYSPDGARVASSRWSRSGRETRKWVSQSRMSSAWRAVITFCPADGLRGTRYYEQLCAGAPYREIVDLD